MEDDDGYVETMTTTPRHPKRQALLLVCRRTSAARCNMAWCGLGDERPRAAGGGGLGHGRADPRNRAKEGAQANLRRRRGAAKTRHRAIASLERARKTSWLSSTKVARPVQAYGTSSSGDRKSARRGATTRLRLGLLTERERTCGRRRAFRYLFIYLFIFLSTFRWFDSSFSPNRHPRSLFSPVRRPPAR